VQVAQEAETTPARAALKWLHSQPGVTAPIIGARTLAQLEDNLASLDVTLSAEHLRRLSEASEPQLNFPAAFLKQSGTFRNPGMVINGEAAADNPMAAPGKRKTY
jgi:diketogulonate reductase-like aldo/keto reductase